MSNHFMQPWSSRQKKGGRRFQKKRNPNWVVVIKSQTLNKPIISKVNVTWILKCKLRRLIFLI